MGMRLRQRERELAVNLNDKEILLSEIHHRVKNNLALISGIFELEAFEENNAEARERIYDCVSRIKTLGNIHEQTYRTSNFSEVNFGQSAKKIVNAIVNKHEPEIDVELNFEIQPLRLNINQAIPCSLFINEIICHLFKHDFNRGEEVGIGINLTSIKERIFLSITCNSNRCTENWKGTACGKTLGIGLADILAKQLDGKYSCEYLEGKACFVLMFEKSQCKGGRECFKKSGWQVIVLFATQLSLTLGWTITPARRHISAPTSGQFRIPGASPVPRLRTRTETRYCCKIIRTAHRPQERRGEKQ